mgnify:CR=1 FL=1
MSDQTVLMLGFCFLNTLAHHITLPPPPQRMSQARMKALADKPPRSPETESEDSDVSSSLDRVGWEVQLVIDERKFRLAIHEQIGGR